MTDNLMSDTARAAGLTYTSWIISRLQQLDLIRENRGRLREPGSNFTCVRERPAKTHELKLDVQLKREEKDRKGDS
jgi:hypothetical protein